MTDRTAESPRPSRIGIIDAARGVALLAMASYHFTWDMEFFGYLEPGTATQGALKLYARAIAGSFLFLVGVSLVLAHVPAIRWPSFWRRLAMVVAAALAITVATWFATPDAFIFFGILHQIALASLIGLLFVRLPWAVTLLAGLVLLALPLYTRSAVFDTPWLWWVGLSQQLPRSNDYVPLLPWTGVVLVAIALTRLSLAAGLRERLARLPSGPAPLSWIGRHSLAFYLLHQPVLIALAYLLTLVVPPAAPDPTQGFLSSCAASCQAQGNDAAGCDLFCTCTLDGLQRENLFALLQSGAIQPGQDERILRIANECSVSSQ